MIRSTLALLATFALSIASAHGQAIVGGGVPGVGNGGAPTTALGFVEAIESGQQAGATPPSFSQGSYASTYGLNNGFGYYTPAFAVGSTGLGLPGLNGINGNYNYSYNNIASGYGANALSPLLLGRTIGNSSYYGNPVLTNVPYGVSNLYQLMPNQNVGLGSGATTPRQISGPKTNPGEGVVGTSRGNSEASAILNGAIPTRENPRAARKAKSNSRRSLARKTR